MHAHIPARALPVCTAAPGAPAAIIGRIGRRSSPWSAGGALPRHARKQPMTTTNTALRDWVAEDRAADPARPRFTGARAPTSERDELTQLMLGTGDLIELNQATFPNCYLHRSHPSDVARVEHLTFICTQNKDDAGPNNNWMAPDRGAREDRRAVCRQHEGPHDVRRALLHGPDRLALLTLRRRNHRQPLRRAEHAHHDAHGHAGAEAHRARRHVRQGPALGRRPRSRTSASSCTSRKSSRSRASARATAATRCSARSATRCASRAGRRARKAGSPSTCSSSASRIRAAKCTTSRRRFPSACGKTNLGMLIPPETMPGWKVWTIGEDIAWLHVGNDGRLRAINPEAGFFGVVPGTSPKTNRNAYEMIHHDTIFTNVALTADNEPWWEGRISGTPVIDWQGRPYDKATANGAGRAPEFTLHRFGQAEPRVFAPHGAPGRRADLGDHVRRTPPRSRAARLRSSRLDARRHDRRRHGVGDDRRGRRARWASCVATRWR